MKYAVFSQVSKVEKMEKIMMMAAGFFFTSVSDLHGRSQSAHFFCSLPAFAGGQ